ncbi:hypothetical protein soil367_18885 (plasmid) [Hydrocarboniclastica marina]|uniref:Ig-like domain-containing protein n=2 Tax=Hydrocarboniclastica marina TaxID=2259620 RepID=A0A4P7XLX4_9ALTE|nr:hypothetical protein soil367_18885 [Hydrocarboniclastica marina]
MNEFVINYLPELFSHRSGNKLSIPAIDRPFHWSDGSDTFVTNPIVVNGEVMSGIRPIYAGVRKDAGLSFIVNGVEVSPGEYKQVHSRYDFELMDGVLQLPMSPAYPGEASVSDVIISIGGDGELASIVTVDAWTFNGKIENPDLNPTRIFDEFAIRALSGTEDECELEASKNNAKTGGVLDNLKCWIDWFDIPSPLKPSTYGDPTLRGTIDHEGSMGLGYRAYVYDSDGSQHLVGEAYGEIHGNTAMGVVDYDFENDISTVYHTVQDIRMTLKQTDGPTCRLTVDEEYAKSFATRESRVKFCYLEWEHLPGTLAQEPQSLTPNARGRVFYTGEYQASFRVYAYTSIGTPVLVQQKTLKFEAIEPPPPKVTIVGGEPIVQNLYPVPTKGGKVLDVEINAENAAIRVSEFFNGGVIKKDEFPAVPWQVNFRNYQRIALDQTPLWTRSTHEVEALYTDLPNLRGSVFFDSLSVPGEEVRPVMSTDGNVALNDDKITLKISIRDIYNQSEGYSPQTMGNWDVRVVQQESYDRNSPVTEWVSIDAEGNASLPLDLEALDMASGILRLYAEARVRSPVPEYSKTVTSSQPVTVTVLYGGQIDAELDARYISGEAPFRTVFSLELMDRNLFSALGDVEWYIQKGEQGDWEKFDNTNRNPRVFERTFDEGIYYVKAKLLNRNSEAQTETPPLKVISYHKPRLEVEGPAVVFVGDTVEMTAVASFDGEPLVPGDVVMQWSEDAGKTWKEGGFDYVLTRDAEDVGRVRLHTRARMPIAPAEDRNAWTENKGSVEFRTIRPPRTYIYGPRVAEVGKEHKYQVHLGLPYARMGYEVKGFFTMPDGTEVEGDTAFYTPSSEELAETYAFIKYTAYIVGWREQGAEQVRDQRIRLWEYDFPEFQMSERYSASVAPADATLYVRPVNFRGRLENPVYEWEFPKSVEVIEDRNPIARKLRFAEPGNYPLTVTITDDRGNVAKIEKVIALGVPDPYNADFVISGDARHIRDPYEILVRPVISGGHPRDYIVDRKYYLNGEPMGSYGSYGQAILGAGTSTIKMEITSKFGEKAVKEEKFTVNENQPPVCELERSDRLGSWLLRADCSDPDGNVKTHNWWVDGEKLSLSGYRISINDSGTEPVEIQLSAVDDSGEESSKKTVILERPAQEPKTEPEPEP